MRNKIELLKEINESIELKSNLIRLEPQINQAIQKIFITLKKNCKVFICGNGGSAADAQHLSAEFLVRLNPKVNRRPFPVISWIHRL